MGEKVYIIREFLILCSMKGITKESIERISKRLIRMNINAIKEFIKQYKIEMKW